MRETPKINMIKTVYYSAACRKPRNHEETSYKSTSPGPLEYNLGLLIAGII